MVRIHQAIFTELSLPLFFMLNKLTTSVESHFSFNVQRFYVYYDLWWSCQHVLFVWIGSLILLMKYLAPLQYCDTLSKCAVHLGGWAECDEDDEIPDNPRE